MEQLAAEARAVVTQLRKRVTARRARWQPRPLPAPPVRLPMTADPALEYLHRHWALPDGPAAPPPGPLWKRLLWRVVGRFVFGTLSAYLHQERELLSRVVQVCDTLAKRVDTLEADIEQLALATSRQLAEVASYLPDPGGDPEILPGPGGDPENLPSPGDAPEILPDPGDAPEILPDPGGPPEILPDADGAPGMSEHAEPQAVPDPVPSETSGTAGDPGSVHGTGADEASQTSPPAPPVASSAVKPRTSTPATRSRPGPRAKPSPAPPRRKRAGPDQ